MDAPGRMDYRDLFQTMTFCPLGKEVNIARKKRHRNIFENPENFLKKSQCDLNSVLVVDIIHDLIQSFLVVFKALLYSTSIRIPRNPWKASLRKVDKSLLELLCLWLWSPGRVIGLHYLWKSSQSPRSGSLRHRIE